MRFRTLKTKTWGVSGRVLLGLSGLQSSTQLGFKFGGFKNYRVARCTQAQSPKP